MDTEAREEEEALSLTVTPRVSMVRSSVTACQAYPSDPTPPSILWMRSPGPASGTVSSKRWSPVAVLTRKWCSARGHSNEFRDVTGCSRLPPSTRRSSPPLVDTRNDAELPGPICSGSRLQFLMCGLLLLLLLPPLLLIVPPLLLLLLAAADPSPPVAAATPDRSPGVDTCPSVAHELLPTLSPVTMTSSSPPLYIDSRQKCVARDFGDVDSSGMRW
mmetsp:Transcript_8182/g.15987  ORF Transcript_8182/g.15987 Transcript_8182/m.15987 type:complete len:217 (+) Transcript_8182:2847-3497(+)